VTSEEGDNQTTQNSISPSNEESDLVSTTENDLDSLPEAECDPSSCEAPAGYEFCQPLPVSEGECCPSQYECNLSTTTDGPTTTIIVSVSEDNSEISTTISSDTEDHTDVVTESIDNADGESEGETLTTETSIGESNEGIDQAEEISTTISSDTEDHTESSTDIIEDGVTTQTSISPSNEETDLVSTTENDLDSLPEAECDPSSCEAPSGYEFCQPLPVAEGECCPSQYECNVSTTTDGPTTTIVVSVTEDNSEIPTTTVNDLDSLPEAECDPSTCKAPAGYEFCQPLPVEEGECCPSQYECNVSTTTDGPTTTVVVSVSENGSDSGSVSTQESETDLTTEGNSQSESITDLSDSDENFAGSSTLSDSGASEITTDSGIFTDSEENETTEENQTTLTNNEEVTTVQGFVESEEQEITTESGSEDEDTNTDSEQSVTEVNSITETVTTDEESVETVTLVDSATEEGSGSIDIGEPEETVSETPLETETEDTNASVETTTKVESAEETEAAEESGNTDIEVVTENNSEQSTAEVISEGAVEESGLGSESGETTTEGVSADAITETNSIATESDKKDDEELGSGEETVSQETTTQSKFDAETQTTVSATTGTDTEGDSVEITTGTQESITELNADNLETGTESSGGEGEGSEEVTTVQSFVESEQQEITTESGSGDSNTVTDSEQTVTEINSFTEATTLEGESVETVTLIDLVTEEGSGDVDIGDKNETGVESEDTNITVDSDIETETEKSSEQTTTANNYEGSATESQETDTETVTKSDEIATDGVTEATATEISAGLTTTEIVDDEATTELVSEETVTELVPQLESEAEEPANEVVSEESETETLTVQTVTETVSEETNTEVASEETTDTGTEGSGTEETVSELVDPVSEESVAVNELDTDSEEDEEDDETTDASVTDSNILTEEDVLTQETSNKVEEKPEAGSIEKETTLAPLVDIEASQAPLIESVEQSAAITTESNIEETSSKKPSMKFCLHKGMIIQNLADVPSKNACQLCQCVEGEIICATQECQAAPQEDCVKIVTEGECCPKYDCDGSTDETTASSGEVDLIKTTASAEIQDDDTDDYEEGEDEIILELPSTTLKPAPTTTFRPITSPKPVSTTQLTTLLTTTLAQEGLVTTVTPAGINQNDDGTFGTASGTSLDNDEYIDFDLESIGPGACLFENKIYVSAQQIPRDNPCDFCFCFRGDIICLQQSCPPPIPGCTEEIISGFCCPRYECPVKMSFHNVTKHITHATEPPSIASWFGWGAQQPQQEEEIYSTEVKGCEVQGEFYETGAIVTASSGPCLQCRCDYNEKLDCEPQDCETQPLIKRMMENFR